MAMLKEIETLPNEQERRYSMKLDELFVLLQKFDNNPYELATAAFRYGFVKGRRCESASRKAAGAMNEERKGKTA